MLTYADATGEAQQAYDLAIKEGRVPEPMPNPDVLLRSDFIQNEVHVSSSRVIIARRLCQSMLTYADVY